MKHLRFLLPFVALVILVVFLGIGLQLNPRKIPSPLIDKAAPVFELPQLQNSNVVFSSKDMLGKVWLLNVWASWCVACRQEHPVLVDFARQHIVPIYGLNYKDEANDAKAWLENFGNPYDMSLVDYDGRVGIDYGVYGVPETYLIDKQGIIRYKEIGPVSPSILENKILPLVSELSR